MKKINCLTAEQWVVKMLDEGLSADDRLRLEEHLRECPACSRMKEATREALDLVVRDVPADPGEEFWTRYDQSLAARLQEKEVQSSWWFGWKVAAAAVFSGIVIFSVFPGKLDWRVKQTPEAQQSAAQVVNELVELYGPIQEERTAYGLSADQSLTTFMSQASYNGGIAGWFEVEDETDQLFM